MPITPQFSLETESIIVNRMLTNVSNDVDKRQGSVAYDLLMPTAIELSQAYFQLDTALNLAFINENMPSDILTIAASEFGIDRRTSIRSTGQVTLSGNNGITIPTGTRVRTNSGVYFVTTEDSTIVSGSIDVAVRAEVGGIEGNVASGEINTVIGDLAGVVSVTNALDFTNGIAEESDTDLIQRVYNKLRRPATSGNIYHYEQWATEVSGVSAARVIPLAFGPGTVQVIVLGSNNRAPSPEVISAVVSNIEDNKPIGATVTVGGVTELPINVVVDLELAVGSDISEVTDQITAQLNTYLQGLAFVDDIVRYNRIASIIIDDSRVLDYRNLEVNGGTVNIQTQNTEVAVTGTVTTNAL